MLPRPRDHAPSIKPSDIEFAPEMNVADSFAPHRLRQWSERNVTWMGAAVIAAIVLLAIWGTVRSYRAAVEENGRLLESGARIVAEQTARSVQATDIALANLAAEYGRGELGRLTPQALHYTLRGKASDLVQASGLAWHDADGNALGLSWMYPIDATAANVADRPQFQHVRDQTSAGLVIGNALRSTTDGLWFFPLSRRITDPSGNFAGMLSARGSIAYYEQFYRDIQPDVSLTVTLMHRDGTLLARYPRIEGAYGKRYGVVDDLVARSEEARPAPLRVVSPVDNVERFAAVRAVPNYPLVVVMTRDVDAALAGWRQQAQNSALRTLAGCALAAFLVALLRRQFGRLDRARQSLEASRERFALAVAGSDDGIWDWDYDTGIAFSSRRGREIVGMPLEPETQPLDEWFALLAAQVHPDDRARRDAALQAHLSGTAPAYEVEYRARRADGSYGWVRVRGVCSCGADGKPRRMSGSVSDIDARKRAEDSLRQSEERYALAMTGARSGHWVWEVGTDALFVSGQLNQLFGLPEDTVATTRTAYFANVRLHDRADLDVIVAAERDMLVRGADRADFEYRIVLPAGDVRWISTRAQAFRDDAGNPVRVAGVSVDVSARKQTELALRQSEEALRESEERYALAMTGSNEGHWVWNMVTDELFVSARLNEIFGFAAKPLVTTHTDFNRSLPRHPEDATMVIQARQDHIDGRTPRFDLEYRLLLADGTIRWVHTRAQCFRDASGRPIRMAGAITDITDRRRTEQALIDSEERFALAVAGSDDGIFDWDYESGTGFGSHRAREILGLPPGPESLPLADWYAAIEAQLHPDDVSRRRDAIEAHLSGKTPAYDGEYRVRGPNGAWRWIAVRGLSVRRGEARPHRMAGSFTDIDARKRAEDALRLSQERLAIAMTGTHEAHWVWDLENDQVYLSPIGRELFGLPPDAELIHGIDNVYAYSPMPPEDREAVLQAVTEHLAGRTPRLDIEYRVVHRATGKMRWVHSRAQVFRDDAGKPTRLAGATVEVTKRRQAEQALRESEERYALAIEGSNEGLWDWDLRKDTLFLSPRAQMILGFAPDDPVQTRREWNRRGIFHPDDVGLIRKAVSDHLRGRTPAFVVEYRMRNGTDPEWKWFRERGIALRDTTGRPYRMAGSLENITARKTAEAQRAQLEAQLRQAQKLEAIGTLAGGIAHDFNNILAAILGYGEMAQKDAAEGTPLRRHLDAALSAALRAKSLVERILAFSRSGIGERVPVHVQAVVHEALDLVAASLPAGVALDRRIDCGNAAVLGDPVQVHQVVMNLCANAAQAIRARGTISVTLEDITLDKQLVTTSVLPAGRYVRLQVRDTGTGIAAHVLERIFDPFFTTKEVGVGTGLGLSLVHGIVTDLGGGIQVESQVGDGSLFTVYMPWHGDVAAPQAETVTVEPGTGETILLVDDEETLVRLGEEMIAELGYEPVGFTSSLAALATFRAEPQRFNAVLSDEAMPDMTGSELAREIRKIRPDIPIVLMSGYVTAALSTRARDAGVLEVLNKPLARRDIARSLAGALRT